LNPALEIWFAVKSKGGRKAMGILQQLASDATEARVQRLVKDKHGYHWAFFLGYDGPEIGRIKLSEWELAQFHLI
jgi:hypothetical protein